MSRLDRASEVADLAATLGLGGAANPVDAILGFCRRRIDGWVQEVGGVASIADLETLVTRKLQMVFEEVWSDEDFDRIKAKYATGKKDFVFAAMQVKFDDADNPTYGALVKRKNVGPDAPDRYVAMIDCRGFKAGPALLHPMARDSPPAHHGRRRAAAATVRSMTPSSG